VKIFQSLTLYLFAVLVLTSCSTNTNEPPEETLIPQDEQEKYLSHATPPQQYGFSVYPLKEGGITYRGNARLHPRHLSTANILKDDIPVIKMRGRFSRDKLNTLLDISSPISWIEFKKSQELNVKFMGMNNETIPYRGNYNTGQVNAFAGIITQLRIEGLFMEDVPFFVRMASGSLGPLARGIREPHVDAILGYDNLSAFEYIQFNLTNGIIQFSSTIPYVPHDSLLMTKARIANTHGYGLAVEGAIFGQETPILLDFTGNYSFARSDEKADITKQISVGGIVFRNVPTLALPLQNSPPRIGRQLLKQYIVTICNNEGVVYFERPPE
jgi:hypothetical protein